MSNKVSSSKDGNKYKLEIKTSQTNDAGEYAITASNLAGEVQLKCSLLVNQPPSFDKELADAVTVAGQSCKFSVISGGIPEPIIKWYKDGVEITANDHFTQTTKGHLHSLLINNVSHDDDGKIVVEATNEAGTAKSSATHTVHGEPFVVVRYLFPIFLPEALLYITIGLSHCIIFSPYSPSYFH